MAATFHHTVAERIQERFRAILDSVISFFTSIFIALAWFFKFSSKIIARGAFYGIFFVALFMCVKWISLPTILLFGHPLTGLGAAIFLFATAFVVGLFFYILSRFLESNIHRAVVIPSQRTAEARFMKLMNSFDLNESPEDKKNSSSFYNLLKTGLSEYLEKCGREGRKKDIEHLSLEMVRIGVEAAEYERKLKGFPLHLDSKPKDQLIRSRVHMLIYLKMAQKLDFSPQEVSLLFFKNIQNGLELVKMANTEDQVRIKWMDGLQKYLGHVFDRASENSAVFKDMISLIQKIWDATDREYYGKSSRTSNVTLWAELYRILNVLDPNFKLFNEEPQRSAIVSNKYTEKHEPKESKGFGKYFHLPHLLGGKKDKQTAKIAPM